MSVEFSSTRTGRRRVTKGAVAAAGAVTAYAVPMATRVARGQTIASPPPATPTTPPQGATPTPTPIPGAQGCTPGYWRQQQHFDSWVATGYAPTHTVGSVFVVPAGLSGLADDTLVDALQYGGGPGVQGGAEVLLRAAVAALLNAAHPGVNYGYESGTATAVIEDVNAALASGNRNTMLALAAQLDTQNNAGCPLN